MLGLAACRNAHVERGPRLGRRITGPQCVRLFVRLHEGHLAVPEDIVAAVGARAKAFLPLFRALQHVVEHRAVVGLDDVQFPLADRDSFAKVVNDLAALGWLRSTMETARHAQAADTSALVVVRVDPRRRSRAGLPPHRISRSFVILRTRTRAIDDPYPSGTKAGARLAETRVVLGDGTSWRRLIRELAGTEGFKCA